MIYIVLLVSQKDYFDVCIFEKAIFPGMCSVATRTVYLYIDKLILGFNDFLYIVLKHSYFFLYPLLTATHTVYLKQVSQAKLFFGL